MGIEQNTHRIRDDFSRFHRVRNSLSSHGKWLRSLQRRTAAFCRLNHTASTIPTMNALAGTWGRDLRPPLKLDDSVEKQYFYRKRVFHLLNLNPA
jgi:hypothetical protein